MIVDFECKCGRMIEEYYPSYLDMPKEKLCDKCKRKMKRLFGSPSISMKGTVSGYEKANQDNLTLGKAIDMKQKWV